MKKLAKLSLVLATIITGANASLLIHPIGSSFRAIDNLTKGRSFSEGAELSQQSIPIKISSRAQAEIVDNPWCCVK